MECWSNLDTRMMRCASRRRHCTPQLWLSTIRPLASVSISAVNFRTVSRTHPPDCVRACVCVVYVLGGRRGGGGGDDGRRHFLQELILKRWIAKYNIGMVWCRGEACEVGMPCAAPLLSDFEGALAALGLDCSPASAA